MKNKLNIKNPQISQRMKSMIAVETLKQNVPEMAELLKKTIVSDDLKLKKTFEIYIRKQGSVKLVRQSFCVVDEDGLIYLINVQGVYKKPDAFDDLETESLE